VLALLVAGPLHPYGMQRLIKTWGKDEVVNIGQRANLYKTIRRLHEAGLITVRQTERDQQYPERTVYELTEEGRTTGLRWLVDMLATPRSEYPAFAAALSFAMLLSPEQVTEVLSRRLVTIEGRLAQLESQLQEYRGTMPRIAMVETEYQRAVTEAEVRWLSSVVDDLKDGKLTWNLDQITAQAAGTYSLATNS
jgi:DNA-binding PadR family transcriptional regulator